MKNIQSGSGDYGYTYIVVIELVGGSKKEERYTFWCASPEVRDAAMRISKSTIRNSKKWKKVSR